MKKLSFAFLLGAAIAAGGLTYAQSQMSQGGHGAMNHGAMDHGAHGAQVATSDNPVIAAYMAANDRMHADMAIEFTGDADVDFVRGMIPHHQGAIDMAEVLLAHGEDEQMRTLAQEIIDAQEAEIEQMTTWLVENAN